MKKKLDPEELNLVKLAKEYSDEDKARKLFESIRWPDGPVCPHCRNHKEKPIYALKPKKGTKTVQAGLYKCGACRKKFTATVGTVMSDSHIPISKWIMAMFIICSSKKSVSAHQLHRMLKMTYRSAWFMAHRLRFAMTPNNFAEPKLTGTVEADETWVGGRGDRSTKSARKTPVVALVERDGNAKVIVVPSVTAKNLGAALNECVDKSAVVHTDEHPGYKKPLKQFGGHHAVNHSQGEYQRRNPDGSVASTNTAESFFSLLKRSVYGAWHCVSREHLWRYANEIAFRWNHRRVSDGERMANLIPMIDGKRLTYRTCV